MFSTRKNTFETNSSSTHCLAFDGKVKYDDQYLLNMCGVITPYQDGDDIQYDEINIYTRPEDKIKWILTSLRQANYETDHLNEYKNTISNYLKELCPNVKIDFFDNLDSYYEWEDIEYAWSDYELECNCLLTSKEDFKKFLLQGTVIWGNRDLTDDNGWTSIINNVIKEYPIIWCKWSG